MFLYVRNKIIPIELKTDLHNFTQGSLIIFSVTSKSMRGGRKTNNFTAFRVRNKTPVTSAFAEFSGISEIRDSSAGTS
jgi:hypothetical protein